MEDSTIHKHNVNNIEKL